MLLLYLSSGPTNQTAFISNSILTFTGSMTSTVISAGFDFFAGYVVLQARLDGKVNFNE